MNFNPYQILEDSSNYPNYEVIVQETGQKKLLLLGESSHGTSEFYKERAEISKRLITEKGFSFIGVEGDWPDCFKINQYIKGEPEFENAYDLLITFDRWPTWMWANSEMIDFIEWLRNFNLNLPEEKKVGFYGLDVYSLWQSLEVIDQYFKKNNPKLEQIVKNIFSCFEPYYGDEQGYAWSTRILNTSCENEVSEIIGFLSDIISNPSTESDVNLIQNAKIVADAENYYRKMLINDASSWNLRDNHMADTALSILGFYEHRERGKGIIWAHNTHVGDARATNMGDRGEINLGQLLRERLGEENIYIIGFDSYYGEVIASDQWNGPATKMFLPKATPGSWEETFHRLFMGKDRLIIFSSAEENPPMGQRAVGVVYNPLLEFGNYVPTRIESRYDALIFINQTTALSPLHVKAQIITEPPETYPTSY